VVDAQGLLKSALLTRLARGRRGGFGFASVRERPAALGYQDRVAVPRDLHAAERLRRLFSALLGYRPAAERPGHGLDARVVSLRREGTTDEVLLLHGTTWADKHWPEAHWRALAARLSAEGLAVRVPFGDEGERLRAERIATAGRGDVVARGGLGALLDRLARARAVVGVDAGPIHLAAAADVPGVALYGPTDPARTGPWSARIAVLRAGLPCEPCLARRCASPLPPLRGEDGGALEPPCLGRIAPGQVAARLLALLREG
jgi:heptosyltransferase-1